MYVVDKKIAFSFSTPDTVLFPHVEIMMIDRQPMTREGKGEKKKKKKATKRNKAKKKKYII